MGRHRLARKSAGAGGRHMSELMPANPDDTRSRSELREVFHIERWL